MIEKEIFFNAYQKDIWVRLFELSSITGKWYILVNEQDIRHLGTHCTKD